MPGDDHSPQSCPLGARVDSLKEDLADVKVLVGRMADAVERLTRLEERHTNTAAALDRAFNAIQRLGDRVQGLHDRLSTMANVDDMDERLDAVESDVSALKTAQPEQRRIASWVDKAVWALLSASAMYVAMKMGLAP